MTDEIDKKKGISGSISGFDKIILTDEGTINEVHPADFTVSDVITQLRSLLLIYNPERLYEIIKKIDMHLQDLSNPHQVTLNQLTSDPVKELLSPLLPGLPIAKIPKYGIQSIYSIPLIADKYIRDSVSTYVDRDGIVKSLLKNEVATDFMFRDPILPLYPEADIVPNPSVSYLNIYSSPMLTVTKSPMNTSLIENYRCSNVQSEHGLIVFLSSAFQNNKDYSTSFFIHSELPFVSIKINNTYTTVNLFNNEVIHNSDYIFRVTIQSYLFNNWKRVTFSYTKLSDFDTIVLLVHPEVSTVHAETLEHFYITMLQTTQSYAAFPYIPDSSLKGSLIKEKTRDILPTSGIIKLKIIIDDPIRESYLLSSELITLYVIRHQLFAQRKLKDGSFLTTKVTTLSSRELTVVLGYNNRVSIITTNQSDEVISITNDFTIEMSESDITTFGSFIGGLVSFTAFELDDLKEEYFHYLRQN